MTEMLWKRRNVSLGSSDLDDRRLLTWVKNKSSASLIGPRVSKATGMNMWEEERAQCLAVFLSAALAVLPISVKLVDKYDMAKVSTTVASHAKQRPPCHGIIVSLSGRRSEPGIRPDGSWFAGMSARRRARQMMSFNCWWRVERPALRLQDSPCSPLESMTLPHRQEWGSHKS